MNQVLVSSHSADVEMWLDCGPYGTVPLARITPKAIVAKDRPDIPACEAVLVVTVDGQFIRNRVMLTSGFSRGRNFARIQPMNDVVPF
jgi:hypothetical protein